MKKHLNEKDLNASVKMKKFYREEYKKLTEKKQKLEKMEQILKKKSLERF